MKFLIKKICTLIMTLFLVSVAAFLAFQVIPGDVGFEYRKWKGGIQGRSGCLRTGI